VLSTVHSPTIIKDDVDDDMMIMFQAPALHTERTTYVCIFGLHEFEKNNKSTFGTYTI